MITLRAASTDDIPLFEAWRKESVVAASDPNDDWDWPQTLAAEGLENLIAELDGRPIGFIQIAQIADLVCDASRSWVSPQPGFMAIDIWIGEESDRSQGHGKAMMQQAIARCFADPAIHTVLIDPPPTKTLASRFSNRMGFRFVEKRRYGDDDRAVYQLPRRDWETARTETSASIAAWAEATFGPASDLTVLTQRARQELDELEEALLAGHSAEAIGEAADVVILLHRVTALLGADLADAVTAKMTINRNRRWRLSGDGVGQHEES